MPSPEERIDPRPLLDSLFGSEPAFAEVRIIIPATKKQRQIISQRFFSWPTEADQVGKYAANANGKANVYFGVCPRFTKGGTIKHINQARSLWADIDFKNSSETEARKRLSEFPLKPSAIVETGGGLHVYWLLREPMTGADLPKVKLLNLAIAAALASDTNACDLARVLRLPDTLNIKYTPHRQAFLGSLNPSALYNPSDFDFLPPAVDKADPAKAAPIEGKIPDGARNSTLTSIAGMMRRRGLDAEEIKAALDAVNARRCATPLSETEVASVVASVVKYAPSDVIPALAVQDDTTHDDPPISAPDLLSQSLPEIDYVIWPMASVGSITLIQGEPKGGKTSFALYSALSAATGLWLSDRFAIDRPRRTLFVTYEDGARRTRDRIDKYARGMGLAGVPDDLLIYTHATAPEFSLDTPKGCATFRKTLLDHAIEYVVLDTLSDLHSRDENKASDMKPVMKSLKDAVTECGVACAITHHTRKPGQAGDVGGVAARGRGSSVIAAKSDMIFDFGSRVNNTTPCKFISKDDDDDEFAIKWIPQEDESILWRITDLLEREDQSKLESRVFAVVEDIQARTGTRVMTRSVVEALTDVAENTVRNYLKMLARKKRIDHVIGQNRAQFWGVLGVQESSLQTVVDL